jgi:phosphatidylserine/phosphatidylglycerophosphate/cardiolipin synthase-like enzyme
MPIERRRVLYVSPADNVHDALLAVAQAATVSLYMSIYGFTLDDLAEVFIAKHQAGLQVGIVADRSQAAGPAERAILQKLVNAGVPVTIATAPTGAINHEKVLLVDLELGADHNQSFAVYGSFNFSFGAAKQENHLQTDNDPSVCAYLWKQYQETEAHGKLHPEWQLVPQVPPVPAV